MSYFLSPINAQIVDANGDPLSGGKIYTYQAGTTTPVATYTDSTGGTAQANPIILNSLGVPASPIWLQGGVTYKFVIKDSADATQRTIDGIAGVNDVSSSAAEWNESGFVPTYINATQFSVPGDQTSTLHVNRRVRTRNTGGNVYGRISVSSYSASITTVTVVNDSGALDSGLSAVAYGFLSFTPASIPYAMYAAAGANSDITSLTALATVSGNPNFSGAPTATTAATNDSSTKIATTAFVNPASSLGTSGHVELSSGLIIQWVTGTASVNANQTIAFPIPFPNNVYSVIASGKGQYSYSIAVTSLVSFTTSSAVVQCIDMQNGANSCTPTIWAFGN